MGGVAGGEQRHRQRPRVRRQPSSALTEAGARGAAALQDPGDTLVLFTVRPDRWLTFDFTEDEA